MESSTQGRLPPTASRRRELAASALNLVFLVPSGCAIPTEKAIKAPSYMPSCMLSIVERLQIDYLAGVRVADLAEHFGITRQTVFEHVRRLGLPHRHPKLSPEETAKAAGLYEAGNSLAVVGAVLDVDPGTLRRALARAGLSIRDPHGRDR
jgi:hypothetical protein